MERKVNWFGLAGGIATLTLIIASWFFPWWQFTLGDSLLKANISPLNINFNFLTNSAMTVPLLWALNMASILTMAIGGIVMLIYSVLPSKPYSMRLLGFAYKKPVYAVGFFIVSLFTMTLMLQGLLGLSIPLMGSATVTLPLSLTQGAIISAQVSADFLWPFWFAVAVAILCIAARIYHHKVATPNPSAPVSSPSL